MELENIRQSVRKIGDCLDSLKSNLIEIMHFINERKFIDSEQIEKVIENLLILSNSQKECEKEFTEAFPNEECLRVLNDISAVIDKYEAELEETKLKNEAKAIIARFACIRSSVEKCQQSLDEYAEQLRIIDSDGMTLDEYKTAIAPYEELYDVVKSEDLQTKLAYVNKDTIFSSDTNLLLNIITRKVFIDENAVPEESHDTEKAIAVSTASNDNEDIDSNEVTSEEVSTDEEECAEDKLRIQQIIDSGIKIGIRNGYGEYSIIDKSTDTKIASKTFKKDMEKFHNGNGFAILAFDKFPVINADVLKIGHLFNGKQIEFELILDSLCDSGYLMKKQLGEYPPVYDMTKQTLNSLSVASNMDWFKHFSTFSARTRKSLTSGRNPKVPDEKITNNLLNEICFLICEETMYRIPDHSFKSAVTYLSEYFFAGSHKVNKKQILSMGAFLADEENLTKYIDKTNEFIDMIDGNVELALVFSETAEDCGNIIHYWQSQNEKLTNTIFICYSLDSKKYYENDSNNTNMDIKECGVRLLEIIMESINDNDNCPENEEMSVITPVFKNEEETDSNDNKPEEAVSNQNDTTPDTKDVETEHDIIEKISSSELEIPTETKATPAESRETAPVITISETEAMRNIFEMIASDKAYCASAYLTALSSDKKYEYLRNQLAFAVNSPDKKGFYHSSVIMSFFDEKYDFGVFSEYLKICAELRSLFYHTSNNDYSYKQMYDSMKYIPAVQDDPSLSDLTYLLKEFKDHTGMGIDAVADYRVKENIERDRQIRVYSAEGTALYEQYVNNPIKERCALPRYMDMKKMIFKKDSALSECLKIVADNLLDADYTDYVKEFLYSNFIDEGMEIKSQNIRRHSVGEFIDNFWVEAGRSQRDKQKSSKLVSELRNNINGCIKKIVTVICDWYYYAQGSDTVGKFNGHQKEKNQITSAISSAIDSINSKFDKLDDIEHIAGNKCLLITLEEFMKRMDGTYNDNGNKYYYINFLKYGDVLLNNNYLPELDGFNNKIIGFMPIDRIIRHSKRSDRTFDDRIDEIFNRTSVFGGERIGDDYGSALHIKNYLDSLGEIWDEESNDIDANAQIASKQFRLDYEEIVGTLELAQSYGQIDTDRKEQILAIISNHYNKISVSHNYGYFGRLIDYIKADIKNGSKAHEEALWENLNSVASEYSGNDDAELFISEAKEMMAQHNYTVAEDLIHRIQSSDFSHSDAVMPEDILQDFIREYEKDYRLVGDSSINLVKAIQRNSRAPQKDTKRGAMLIDNFPVGNNTSKERIKTFISYLGFKVKNVTVDTPTSPTHNSFSVELNKNANGKRENFTHPIAAFGSIALQNGFRVLCLFGTYDTRRLLDKFKEVGTSKHTIVLLDYALKLTERRTLARKIKEEIADNIFIVIDRVAAYYLADHYAENKINRMLMEIAMPYAYYQPYDVDSSRPIPVEMFMGRKEQLEDIESPRGANIICGGRQLGKSALLRMAKEDINNNENGDRAVYVEIKGCDSTKAAQKISKVLVDEGILAEGSECDNWDDLSRNIKKRLNTDSPCRIPYLLLLIDEADAFIDSCKNEKYEPFDCLEDIQNVGVNRFKFVVAGLRNLVKFERELATSNNSGLAHLSSKTIRPFTTIEAQELLEKPLHYLGIRFPKDKTYLVSLILANTNYFPGLIHFYCAKLIDAMRRDYAGYDENSTPPYEVNEAHIKKVLADPEFNNQIKEKFEITLKLDADNYYHIIAILMAYCMYSLKSGDGYSAEDIYQVADQYCINKIQKLSVEKLIVLMDELCELNILRKSSAKKYHFARYNFIQLLGSSEEIDNMILTYAEEAEA